MKPKMDSHKKIFLRNEFFTMSVLGALGRSKTYSEAASEDAKDLFRDTLRKKLDEISRCYESTVEEQEHLSNIKRLSDDLTAQFSHCLRAGRFRIGIAQKALNLYLKYLWCLDLIPLPPHCPFDAIIIGCLPNCRDLNWTSLDTIEDYQRLVKAAREKADGETLSEWELKIYTGSTQQAPDRANAIHPIPAERECERIGPIIGWTNTVSRFHDGLKCAMTPYQGKQLKTSEISEIIRNSPNLAHNAQFIQPPDHCSNHKNKGACTCARTEGAIFEQLRRGWYYVRDIA
jgi:hypothetical protein